MNPIGVTALAPEYRLHIECLFIAVLHPIRITSSTAFSAFRVATLTHGTFGPVISVRKPRGARRLLFRQSQEA